MKLFFVSLVAAAVVACNGSTQGSDQTDDADKWLAHIPLAPGATEVERRQEPKGVYVRYETSATLETTSEHFRSAMSVAPWRVTTFDVNYARGSGLLIFRSDEDGVIATTRISSGPDQLTIINMDVAPIVTRTPQASQSEELE